jgi:hypothetical protein
MDPVVVALALVANGRASDKTVALDVEEIHVARGAGGDDPFALQRIP